mmetsp:Transcript_9486/g.21764  ORF Transcript_9486/g.21764 Transcript_9486/m.21764 type:complete len:90 (+) Transcript_9486:1485-1754(+)
MQVRAKDSFSNWKSTNEDSAQNAANGSVPLLMATCGPGVKNGDFNGPSSFFESKGLPKKTVTGGKSNDKKQQKELWKYSEECIGSEFEI